MSPNKLRLLADCIEREFMTAEDRKGWVSDLRGYAKDIERQQNIGFRRVLRHLREAADEKRGIMTPSAGSGTP